MPIPVEDSVLNDLVEKAKDYALMHGKLLISCKLMIQETISLTGICMRRKDAFDRDALHFAPFLLFPSPFPRQEFEKALEIQTVLNELMHKVAHDRDFLESTLANTVTVDDFTKRLLDIHRKVWDEGLAQVSGSTLYSSSVRGI